MDSDTNLSSDTQDHVPFGRLRRFCGLPKLVTSILTVALVGCAPASLTRGAWESLVASDRAAVASTPSCCADVGQIDFPPLDREYTEFRIDQTTPVREFGSYRAPFLALAVSDVAEGQQLELASFSHRKTSMTRFDQRLYLRPAVSFFDAQRQPIERVESPELCWGEKDGAGAAWTRIDIPPGTRFVLVNPSIERPSQAIDTRRYLGDAPSTGAGAVPDALISEIADARKSYHADLYVGLYGLLGIEVVTPGKVPLGRCRVAGEVSSG